jgi:ankyrin repeat protein
MYHNKNFDKVKEPGLFEAAKAGWLPEIRRYIGMEPDLLETFSDDGFTPLSLACSQGHYTIVKYLLEMGASPNTRVKNETNATPLHLAVQEDHYPVAKLLIGHGADVNAKQKGDITPLHDAAKNGNLNMVYLLVNHHASVKAKDADGNKPLDKANKAKKDEIIRYLETFEMD